MIFKLNCERCGDILIRGEIYNHKDKNLCEDCYLIQYLFDRKDPDDFLPDVLQLPRRNSSVVELRVSTKR